MLVKGIIIDRLQPGSNKIKVRIPSFESAGVNQKAIIDALIAYNPGNLQAYNIDDIVILSFEHNQIDQPIILGKLYVGETEKATNYSLANSLSVSEKAVLPVDTMIGNVSYQDLFATVSAFKNNESQNNSNDQKAKSITLTYNKGDLYINLNHFTEADVGKTVELYKTSRKNRTYKYYDLTGRKGYRRPDALGYATVAMTQGSNRDEIFPRVPSWMSNNSYINLSYPITLDDIKTGYIKIEKLMEKWIAFAGYSFFHKEWSEILGTGDCGVSSGGGNAGCMKIKFGLIDRDKKLEFLSTDTIYFGRRCGTYNGGEPDSAKIYLLDPPRLDKTKIYLTIK